MKIVLYKIIIANHPHKRRIDTANGKQKKDAGIKRNKKVFTTRNAVYFLFILTRLQRVVIEKLIPPRKNIR